MLPPAWLGLYFLPRVASDALRPDGSPRDTGVVPPLALPRRMFAGERVRFHDAIRVGETLRRETRLADLSVRRLPLDERNTKQQPKLSDYLAARGGQP